MKIHSEAAGLDQRAHHLNLLRRPDFGELQLRRTNWLARIFHELLSQDRLAISDFGFLDTGCKIVSSAFRNPNVVAVRRRRIHGISGLNLLSGLVRRLFLRFLSWREQTFCSQFQPLSAPSSPSCQLSLTLDFLMFCHTRQPQVVFYLEKCQPLFRISHHKGYATWTSFSIY